MQVEDSEGKTLVYGLKKQGTELSVEGTPPFFDYGRTRNGSVEARR